MKSLKVARDIDRLVYNQFKKFPFWIDTVNFLNKVGIKTIIDVGASSGLATLMFLDLPHVEEIHCFEPDEENYELLIRNTEDYSIVKRYNIGIYYGITEATVVGTGDENPLGYMIEDVIEEHDYIWGTTRYEGKKFKLITLENVIKTSVDLIKLDVEGAEYNIIENSKLLKQSKYLILSFHNHPKEYVENFITKNLPEYHTILFENSDTYSDVLMERSSNESTIYGKET